MLFQIFERIYVINLPRRKERLESFFQNVPADWPFRKPEIFTAVDGSLASPPDWWNGGSGAWGCYKSHLRILEDCLNQGINSVLILEDDAVFVDGFTKKVQEFWKHLPEDWEMVYLGGQHIQENQGLPIKINDWVYKPFNINRCHCYGFRGRKIMEKAYKHLNRFFDWNVPHHVDHYLGELHKQLEKGLYVPKEWLVGQSEGKSDICGSNLTMRIFPSAEETLAPTLNRPCCAVMGGYFGGINTLAGVMKELGLFLGRDLGTPAASHTPLFFEDVYLQEICRGTYSEPWLEEIGSRSDRIRHLRRWAGLQCVRLSQEFTCICGKHPILSLMGEEIMEAWNKPKFICIERDSDLSYQSMQKAAWNWHPRAATYAFNRLKEVRETFFEDYHPPLLRIQYNDLKSKPEHVLSELCNFLGHVPTREQKQHALKLINETEDDCCYAQKDVSKCLQADPALTMNRNRAWKRKKR